ncbi:hypothetical protein ETAA8_66160 [Anatilimnocola aggregata]|uniref:Uncharacterized protein n=1 Tax=Anatilimnocola aggregata TaxID=2528021 RepID=A0A517YMK2_9BACT|nr:hypothetical protein ETAA8_66160 [Anatilimnocola aggregata]
MRRRQVAVVVGLFRFCQQAMICFIGQFINASLRRRIRANRHYFLRCLGCQAFSKRFDNLLEERGTHTSMISRNVRANKRLRLTVVG